MYDKSKRKSRESKMFLTCWLVRTREHKMLCQAVDSVHSWHTRVIHSLKETVMSNVKLDETQTHIH